MKIASESLIIILAVGEALRWRNHPSVPIEETSGTTFEPIDDATQDFDALSEYNAFLEGETKNVLLRKHRKAHS